MCFKLLQMLIKLILKKNQKYRVFTNLYRSYVDRIFRHENIKDKFGKISQEVIHICLNAC